MNAVHFEAVIYALQIASFFLIAGPVMVRTERRHTLALNPPWIASQNGFLQTHGEVALRPFRVATLALLSLLAAAAATSSRQLLFAIHTVLFLAVTLAFYVYYDRTEKHLRSTIPEDPIRRAALSPRTLRAFLPGWALGGLSAAAAAILGLNVWGYAARVIEPSRALANATFLILVGVGMGLLLRHTLRRAAYRMSAETDSSGRSLELSLTLSVAAFMALVCLYHSLGSCGPVPLFAYPPTQLHALIENAPWSWAIFFERSEYRWVELGTALVIALFGPWQARSTFNRRIMAADSVKVRSVFEV